MILLDTHVAVWFAEGDERLASGARQIAEKAFAASQAGISPISFWEMAMLAAKGRLRLKLPTVRWVDEFCRDSGIAILAVTPEIAVAAGELPEGIPGDPADRIIVATARHHGVPLLTRDRRILAYAKAGHLQVIDARR